ncbi:MAG: NADH-quinone oxidoreductase subunit NuoK [Elusimicrobia bacterium]|nr:NADH-quinone oxidoreductase subunit NuoK [Elusimicrobiota bacterium]MDE2237308.1 NADH-quinone oxidoreductase subunit NuoK [Elusimicrobiota bacterium]MDE2425449.1 NADH-quinone oxidoreductase subunit NuoK [Elusimicrobiota bacterium]
MTLSSCLLLSGALFLIGIFGALTRRNVIGILMGIELMFNAANLNLAAFNHFLHPGGVAGQCLALFIIAIAAAEVVVGLALVLAINRNADTVYVEEFNLLKG